MPRTRRWLTVGVIPLAAALILTAVPAARGHVPDVRGPADYDPFGVLEDREGTRWVSMSVDQYLASPVVREVQRRMEAVSSGDFRAGDDVVFDDTPRPAWTVVRQGRVARILTRDGRVRTITYVGPDRECTRVARRGEAFSIASDATARFTCRDRRASTKDGGQYVAAHLPTAAVLGVDPAEVRVLIRESTLLAPSADMDLKVLVKDIATLRGVGLLGGPVIVHEYRVRPTRLDSWNDEFNGDAWMIGAFQLSTRGVPDLAATVLRQVR